MVSTMDGGHCPALSCRARKVRLKDHSQTPESTGFSGGFVKRQVFMACIPVLTRKTAAPLQPPGQAAECPPGLSQPHPLLHRRRGPGFEVRAWHCLSYRHVEPRSRGCHGGGPLWAFPALAPVRVPASCTSTLDRRGRGAKPFAPQATPLVPEIRAAREVLSDSCARKGGGAAGVAPVGAAAVLVAWQELTETRSAILPLVPNRDTLRRECVVVSIPARGGADARQAGPRCRKDPGFAGPHSGGQDVEWLRAPGPTRRACAGEATPDGKYPMGKGSR